MEDLFFKQEHAMIKDMVRNFSESNIAPISQRIDKEEKFPRHIIQQMAQLGLMGVLIPKKYGGAELDMISFVTAIIELGKVDASVAITMAAHNSLGTLPLLIFGTKKQKELSLIHI